MSVSASCQHRQEFSRRLTNNPRNHTRKSRTQEALLTGIRSFWFLLLWEDKMEVWVKSNLQRLLNREDHPHKQGQDGVCKSGRTGQVPVGGWEPKP